MSVLCDACTVYGQAWSVGLTVGVVFTLRTVVHVYSVQLCSRCDVLCVEGLLHSSAQKVASHACPFSPQVCNPPGGRCFLRVQRATSSL